MKTFNSFENAYPGYRVFPVDWRNVQVREDDDTSPQLERDRSQFIVNMDQETANFSSPACSLLPLHYCFLESNDRALRLEGAAKLIVVQLETIPRFPKRGRAPVNVTPLPPVALSLVEALVKESDEVPLSQLVRALTELLSPSLCEGVEEEKLAGFRKFISKHLSEQITTKDIASALGMSIGRLREITQEIMNMTPAAYLREERAQFARDLLATTTISIELIAERTGYSDRFSFTRAFTAATGVSPNVYRESMTAENANY